MLFKQIWKLYSKTTNQKEESTVSAIFFFTLKYYITESALYFLLDPDLELIIPDPDPQYCLAMFVYIVRSS